MSLRAAASGEHRFDPLLRRSKFFLHTFFAYFGSNVSLKDALAATTQSVTNPYITSIYFLASSLLVRAQRRELEAPHRKSRYICLMPKQGSKKLNVVPLGEQQTKQPRGEAVRVKLLDAAEALLLEQDAHQLRLDDVLADAGVARNTLYKHFKDLEALAEEALLRGFARNVELDAQAISGALGRCQSKDDLRKAMTAITRATQSADRAARRMLRIKLLAMASSRPALLERVAAVQTDMTERLADEIRTAQDKGYVRSDFPARTAALFIQSYTIGRVLLDVEPHTKKDETDWINLIDQVIELALLP